MATLSFTARTDSAEHTQELARRIGAGLQPGTVVALAGELGAGKTTFVQGLAAGLGVADLSEVLSPTYALVNEHPDSRVPLVHIDFYRLEDPDALRALGIEESLARADAVVAVEWADKHEALIPAGAVWIRLAADGAARRIEVTGITEPID